MPQGTVEVILIEGHDLKNLETFGKSDPYAILSCGGVTHRSCTAHDAGSNPSWNQTFLFDILDGIPDLSIAIYDQERHGNDRPMGSILIPLGDLYLHREIPQARYKVRLPGGRFQGEIQLWLRFSPKIYNGSLKLHLIEGHGLIETDIFDKSDAYAIITCNKQTLRSKVMENAGSNPVWDEWFLFEINSEVTEVSIELFDCDTFSADDPMGSVLVCIPKVPYHRQVMGYMERMGPHKVKSKLVSSLYPRRNILDHEGIESWQIGVESC